MSKVKITLTTCDWEILRDGVADIACWHLGFEAANPNYKPPPQLNDLVNLMTMIKRNVMT